MDKIKSTIYLDKALHELVEKSINAHDYKSKNDFYIKAIESQILSDTVENGGDILLDKLAKAIEKNTKTLGSRISKGLFRYAVELSIITHMQAAHMNLTADEITGVRGMVIQDVKATRGAIDLEAIANFQNKGNAKRSDESEWDD